MMKASLCLLFLLGGPSGQCQAPARESAASQSDLAAMRIILEEMSADPGNQRAQALLKDLWQANLTKREKALGPGRRVAVRKDGRTGGAAPDADMFTALLRGAADSYEKGRPQDAMILLNTALSLEPAGAAAPASPGSLPKGRAAPGASSVRMSTEALPLVEISTSTVVTPDEAESARQLFRAGIRFYRAGDLAQAAQSFR
ncbi:MAG: hypothetical protein PHU21_04930, partial [Elusimicrobia bacterium]|nr:hypothetical protein [Elusimicrobiota bacterium]